MNFAAINNTSVASGDYDARKASMTISPSESCRSSEAYKVDISEHGRALAEKAKIDTRDSGGGDPSTCSLPGRHSDKELMYLPKAYSDLLPDTFIKAEIGAPTYTGRKLNAEETKNQNEYVALVAQFYREERNAVGIQSNEEYHRQISKDAGLKDEIYRAIKERLSFDPRAMELMEQFNVRL